METFTSVTFVLWMYSFNADPSGYRPVRVSGRTQQASSSHLSTMSSRCWAWQNSPPSWDWSLAPGRRKLLGTHSLRWRQLIERTQENVTAPGSRHTIDEDAAASLRPGWQRPANSLLTCCAEGKQLKSLLTVSLINCSRVRANTVYKKSGSRSN